MSVPSYLYSPLDLNTIELTKELESLGGGDAKTKNIDVYIILNTPIESKGKTIKERNDESKQILWTTNDSIGIRNINVSNNMPMSECMKYYNITNTFKLFDIINNPDHLFPPIKEISNWILDGFNACLISYGARNIGKSLSLFGSYNQSMDINVNNLSDSLIHEISPSLIHSLFKLLFNSINSSNGDITTIGLSCWVLHGNNIYDLFLNTTCDGLNNEHKDTSSIKPLEFISIECPNISVAMQLLVLARIRANKSIYITTNNKDDDNIDNSHFITRIIIHKSINNDIKKNKLGFSSTNGILSHLHIVDLIGTSPIDTMEFDKLSENERIITRDISFQLHSFNKILYQMKSLTKSSNTYGNYNSSTLNLNKNLYPIQPKMTSARDSKLSSMLAPIIQGNTRLFMMAYVRDGKKHYQDTLATLNVIENLTSIISACYKVKNIALSSLELRQYNDVLSPFQATSTNILTNKIFCNNNNNNNNKISLSNKENILSKDNNKENIVSDSNHLNKSNDNNKLQYEKNNSSKKNSFSFTTDIIQENDMVDKANENESCLDSIVDQFHSLMQSIEKQNLLSNNIYQQNHPNLNPNIGTINNNSLDNINKYLFPNIIGKNLDSIQDKMLLSVQTWYNINEENSEVKDVEENVIIKENIIINEKKLKKKKKMNSSMNENTNNSINNTPLNRSLCNSSMIENTISIKKKKNFSSIVNNLVNSDSISIRNSIRNKIKSSGKKKNNDINISNSLSQVMVGEIMNDNSIGDLISEDIISNDLNNNEGQLIKDQINQVWSKSSNSSDNLDSSNDLDDSDTKDSDNLIDNITLNSSLSDTKSSNDSHLYMSDRDNDVSIGNNDSYIRISSGDSTPSGSITSYSDSDLSTSKKSINRDINNDRISEVSNNILSIDDDDDSNHINSSNDEISNDNATYDISINKLIQITQNSINSDLITKESISLVSLLKDDQFSSDNFSLNNYTNSINSYDYLVTRHDGINKDTYTDGSINRDICESDDHFIDSHEKSNKYNNNNNNNKENNTLLLVLENEKLKNVVLSNKMKELEFNLIEEITLKDIELDSLKVDMLKYKSQLRELIDNASLTDIFAKFENDIERITIENQNLRERNLHLESKEFNMDINNKNNDNNNNNNNKNNIKDLLNKYDGGRLNRLQNKIKLSLQNNNILCKEIDELKKKDRNSYLNHKINNDLNRRLKISTFDCEKLNKKLNDSNQNLSIQIKENELIKNELFSIQQSSSIIKNERNRILAEISDLRTYVIELEDEKKRTSSLLRGINPHNSIDSNYNSYDSKIYDIDNYDNNIDKVDSSLTALHEGISKNCPLLLPLLHKLSQEIHADKINSIKKNSILLEKIHSTKKEINNNNTYNNLISPNKNDLKSNSYNNIKKSIENKSSNINFQKYKINKKSNVESNEIIEKGNSFAWII